MVGYVALDIYIALAIDAHNARVGAHLKKSTSVSEYEDVLASWRDSSRIAHFPQEVSPEQVHYFGSGAFGGGGFGPPMFVGVKLVIDVSPEKAEALYQEADQRATFVLTSRDSTLNDSTTVAERVVLENRSHPHRSPPYSGFSFGFGHGYPERTDYVFYFFDDRADGYGIAFHKHRSRIMYWASERT